MVWASEVYVVPIGHRDPCQLGDRVFRIVLQVPANRIGHGTFNAAQLKTIQEVITLSVFVVFSVVYLGEPIRWNHAAGFGFIAIGAWFIFAQFGPQV